ncbi:hypothetical protein [Hyphomonas sp.]|uniref:hypothetical protein n=1 Tax=Hyphomonas sp. TaxID=87 RepID=UPI0025C449C6|nr:hypothetical protein [Hyphomonas sp.]
MAITTNAICNSFKKELLEGTHNFSNPGGNSFKLAMYTNSAALGKSTTSFTTGGQVSSPSGGYSSGGKALVNAGTSLATNTAITDFADLSFVGVTLTARGALIYNDTNGDKAVAVLDFGGDKTATSGTFTIQFPAFTTSAAILRIA